MTENLKQLLKKVGSRPRAKGQSTDSLVGTKLNEEYEILELLGQGAMARVYKAHHLRLDRPVAIKILLNDTPEVVARFIHEIKVHSLLKHSNIVEALDCVTDPRSGQTCFVMEYLEGTSLQYLVRSNPRGVTSEEDIFFVLSQVANALNYAHRQGVIHRDLKPANMVMVENHGDVQMKVVDFGMARLHEQIQRFTKTGHIVGSPLYMSPEQCLGKELDPRSDVYALGLVTYELATGKAPYAGSATLYEVMQSHCDPEKKPDPISAKNQALRLCDRLDAIIYIALETAPEKRFQTVKLYEDALRTWYQGVQKNLSQDELDLFPICIDDDPDSEQYIDPKTLPIGKYKLSAQAPDLAQTGEEPTPGIDAVTADETNERPQDDASNSETKPRSGWRLPEKISTHMMNGFGVVSGQELSYVPQAEPVVGKVMNNRYRVHEIIGEGGFSVVYRAQDLESGKMVALKSLKFADSELSERFSREINLHLELKHPNIVKALERVQIRNQTYFVMELLSGTVLEDYLEREFCVSDFNDICAMVSQLFDALEFAHDQGIIHRDLKPGNIMLIEQGGVLRIKVLDFGLAQIQDAMQRLTRTGMLVGSPAYMSPEHCLGHTLTIQSDIYSLGVLTYELICGNLPYEGDSDIDMVKAHCDKNRMPMALSTFRSDLPATEKLEEILARAMSKSPDARFSDVAEMRRAFDAWWQDAGREADASPFKEKRRRRRKVEQSAAKEAERPQPTVSSKETENLSSIVEQYREAQTETVVKKWRGGARPDRTSSSMVKFVAITIAIFCALGGFIWMSMQTKPDAPVTVQEPTIHQETAATEALKRVTRGETSSTADPKPVPQAPAPFQKLFEPSVSSEIPIEGSPPPNSPNSSIGSATGEAQEQTAVPEPPAAQDDPSMPRRHVKILGAGKYR